MQFGGYAWWTFRYCGHKNVALLDGGRKRWRAEGRPLATDEPAAHAAIAYAPAARDESMRILRDEVLQAVRRGGSVILDGRSPEEYAGKRVGGPGGPDAGAVRAGRRPGARHLHYAELPMPTSASSAAMSCAPSSATRGEDAESSPFRLSHRATVLYSCSRSCGGMARLKVVRTVRDRMGQPGRRAVGALARFTR